MNTAKKQCTHAFSQFTLTNKLLQNLYKYKLTPTAKLVLLELSTYYNPKHADIFPKQRTLADKIGVSERSIVRAISELVKAGLIIIECKYTNHYKFLPKIVSECAENLSEDLRQDDIKQYDNLSQHEPTKEQIKEPIELEDYKILKDYAIKHNAKNIEAYINTLKKNGSAEKILKEIKNIKKRSENAEKECKKYLENVKEYNKTSMYADEWEGFKALGELLKKNKAI